MGITSAGSRSRTSSAGPRSRLASRRNGLCRTHCALGARVLCTTRWETLRWLNGGAVGSRRLSTPTCGIRLSRPRAWLKRWLMMSPPSTSRRLWGGLGAWALSLVVGLGEQGSAARSCGILPLRPCGLFLCVGLRPRWCTGRCPIPSVAPCRTLVDTDVCLGLGLCQKGNIRRDALIVPAPPGSFGACFPGGAGLPKSPARRAGRGVP